MSLEQSVAEIIERQTDRFYGKYRGLVAGQRRSAESGSDQGRWCRRFSASFRAPGRFPALRMQACIAGLFTVPMIGSGVWIEFEAGDVNRPDLDAAAGGAGASPGERDSVLPPTFRSKVLRTDTGLMISINDPPRRSR